MNLESMPATDKRPEFRTNEFYESLLESKRKDPEGFERSFSNALRLTVELYESAKQKSEEKIRAGD